MQILLARLRLLGAAAAVLTLPALLVAGCTTSVGGDPAPQPGDSPAQVTPSARPAPSAGRQPTSGGCRVTVTPGGSSIQSSGTSGRASTVNGHTSFSCGSSPMIAVSAVEDAGVTFAVGGATTTVAPGAEATVGTARIEVMSAGGGRAQFQVTPV